MYTPPKTKRKPLLPKTKSGDRWLLFDFDTWTYDVAYAAEREGEILPFSYVMGVVDTRFEEIMYTLQGTKYIGYLTGKDNFRHNIATVKKYKGNRSGKPYWYNQIRQYLIAKYHAIVVDGMEADDAIAIQATQFLRSEVDCVIVSRDKDLVQVPTHVYTYECGKQKESLRTPSKTNGMLELLKQVITGDTTDNYPGLPGKGEAFFSDLMTRGVAALFKENPISTPESVFNKRMFYLVQLAYIDHYGDTGPERFLEQMRLAFLIRELNEDGSPKLPTLNWSFYERYY